jgi:hypothetical protein
MWFDSSIIGGWGTVRQSFLPFKVDAGFDRASIKSYFTDFIVIVDRTQGFDRGVRRWRSFANVAGVKPLTIV